MHTHWDPPTTYYNHFVFVFDAHTARYGREAIEVTIVWTSRSPDIPEGKNPHNICRA